jgi:hypothetical protein
MINIKNIISRFSNIAKPQKKFLAKFLSISFFSGKANIKNLCRYGNIARRTAYRQIQKSFAFNLLNHKILKSQGILNVIIRTLFFFEEPKGMGFIKSYLFLYVYFPK